VTGPFFQIQQIMGKPNIHGFGDPKAKVAAHQSKSISFPIH
jgi:hypothetical protein